MARELTSAEQAELSAVFQRVGPEPHPPDCCPVCGSGLLLAFGTGLFGCCESCCPCGWSMRETHRAYVLKLRAAVKPVLLSFNPPIEPSDNSDLD